MGRLECAHKMCARAPGQPACWAWAAQRMAVGGGNGAGCRGVPFCLVGRRLPFARRTSAAGARPWLVHHHPCSAARPRTHASPAACVLRVGLQAGWRCAGVRVDTAWRVARAGESTANTASGGAVVVACPSVKECPIWEKPASAPRATRATTPVKAISAPLDSSLCCCALPRGAEAAGCWRQLPCSERGEVDGRMAVDRVQKIFTQLAISASHSSFILPPRTAAGSE